MKTSLYLPVFEALGHEARLRLFNLIYQSGKIGVRPKEMMDKFGSNPGTLDFHLKKLVAAKLIVLKMGGPRGVYCASEYIPYGLLQLLDSGDEKLHQSSFSICGGAHATQNLNPCI
jgi:ArsR family transcriptional regulator, arsenate/arsenite/antimonite-responsive transcriptional repressor